MAGFDSKLGYHPEKTSNISLHEPPVVPTADVYLPLVVVGRYLHLPEKDSASLGSQCHCWEAPTLHGGDASRWIRRRRRRISRI
eukprot:7805342-Pyramimonas_sp.AAC.1